MNSPNIGIEEEDKHALEAFKQAEK